MPIPDYETLMLPVLRLIDGGAKNVAACLDPLKAEFHITEAEAAEMLPSGRVTLLQNRAHWARLYLAKAGLLTSPQRNVHVVTDRGRQLLATNPSEITNATLAEFVEFNDWKAASLAGAEPEGISTAVEPPLTSGRTPEDSMREAHAVLQAALRDEVLQLLFQVTPLRFERMILDLLAAMGYGSGDLRQGMLTKTTGDGGIDGIIHEDALGLDAVYIQAKRYAPDQKVGRPDLQKFVGSLTGESANKGVFVTTSDFSKEAQDYVTRVQHRIVLINGTKLAALMLAHNVGVRERETFYIKSIDEDYFADGI